MRAVSSYSPRRSSCFEDALKRRRVDFVRLRQAAARRDEIHQPLEQLAMFLEQRVAQALPWRSRRAAVPCGGERLPQRFVVKDEKHARGAAAST